jgi:hypothetical protein
MLGVSKQSRATMNPTSTLMSKMSTLTTHTPPSLTTIRDNNLHININNAHRLLKTIEAVSNSLCSRILRPNSKPRATTTQGLIRDTQSTRMFLCLDSNCNMVLLSERTRMEVSRELHIKQEHNRRKLRAILKSLTLGSINSRSRNKKRNPCKLRVGMALTIATSRVSLFILLITGSFTLTLKRPSYTVAIAKALIEDNRSRATSILDRLTTQTCCKVTVATLSTKRKITIRLTVRVMKRTILASDIKVLFHNNRPTCEQLLNNKTLEARRRSASRKSLEADNNQ